jgi:chloride channel 6
VIIKCFTATGAFTLPTLWIIFVLYFFIGCWTHGAGISGGIFIPCLLIGAVYGRFVATVFGYNYYDIINFSTCIEFIFLCIPSCSYLNYWQPQIFGFLINLYPGTYTLIGAASFMGGVLRMTLSLTVILIESTNELSLGVPILLSVLVCTYVT